MTEALAERVLDVHKNLAQAQQTKQITTNASGGEGSVYNLRHLCKVISLVSSLMPDQLQDLRLGVAGDSVLDAPGVESHQFQEPLQRELLSQIMGLVYAQALAVAVQKTKVLQIIQDHLGCTTR